MLPLVFRKCCSCYPGVFFYSTDNSKDGTKNCVHCGTFCKYRFSTLRKEDHTVDEEVVTEKKKQKRHSLGKINNPYRNASTLT